MGGRGVHFSRDWSGGLSGEECANQASTKVQKGLLVCARSFPEASAALMGVTVTGGGEAGRGQRR